MRESSIGQYLQVLPDLLLRRVFERHLCRMQHILNEDAIPRGGIVDKHGGHSTPELAVLNDRAAAQGRGQERTTLFN